MSRLASIDVVPNAQLGPMVAIRSEEMPGEEASVLSGHEAVLAQLVDHAPATCRVSARAALLARNCAAE